MSDTHTLNENVTPNSEVDQYWADLLSPARRRFILKSGLMAAAGALTANSLDAEEEADDKNRIVSPYAEGFTPVFPPRDEGKSPWGYQTINEPTPRPKSIRPGEENGLPKAPRPYTAIKSYHAHFYFDEDTYEKAALVRKWSIERFPVELGNWNLEPRGPHVTLRFTSVSPTTCSPSLSPGSN